MSLKVLIVDDSMLARNILTNLLDWSSFGFEIIGEASDGQDALIFLKNNAVDLVITDIYMPNMSGTDLVKNIHAINPNIVILVLSSFNDFQDVKETLKHGASDYIMKHTVTKESFTPILLKLKKEIIANRNSSKAENTSVSNFYEKKEFIRNLLLTGNASSFNVKNNTYDLSYNAMMLLEIDNFIKLLNLYNDEYMHTIISKIIDISIDSFSDMPNKQKDIIYLENGRFVILIKNHSVNLMSILKTYYARINQRVNEFLHMYCLCGICIMDENLSFNACYKECKNKIEEQQKALKYKNTNTNIYSLSLKQEKDLISGFYTLDKDALINLCKEIFLSSDISLNSAKMLAGEIMSILDKVSEHFSIKLYDILEENNVKLNSLKSMHSVSQIYNWITTIIECILKYASSTKYKQFSDKIKPAISYIHKNYAEDISPEDVASNIGFTRNWLNELFKLETGMNITAYITKVRIDVARKLIEQGETNLQLVSYKSGFAYYSYFSRIFKNEVGVSPIKYLKQFKNS